MNESSPNKPKSLWSCLAYRGRHKGLDNIPLKIEKGRTIRKLRQMRVRRQMDRDGGDKVPTGVWVIGKLVDHIGKQVDL